ncbi:transporter substrate-binding domain-containing protein [Paludibacterium sp. THUN1379]|uniref:substrate-binding periplasmic protein n=1 Tax=Paludibacterium sp. THUN1379 TaxID=3112107 RepID=UPI0030CF62DF
MRLLTWSALLAGWMTLAVWGQTLTVAMEEADNRPFEYLDEQGNLTGFHTELVRMVAADLGWSVQFVRVPWSRAQLLLSTGRVDAVTYMGKTAERQKFAVFLEGNQLHVEHVTLFVRRDDRRRIRYLPPVASMMQQFRFGAPRGYFLGQEISDAISAGGKVDLSPQTQAQLFNMLLARRIDVAVAETLALQLVQPQIPDVASRVVQVPGAVFSGNPMYIAFKNAADGPDLARQFAAAYAKWRRTGAYPWLVARFHVFDRVPDSFVQR